jgi:hypothetical protein
MNKIKIILWILALALTTNAHSNIIGLEKRDYLIASDGLITYDQSTGLEWLSPAFTQGLSMLEVDANVSIWADGWHWTTIDQMETMFDRANTPSVHPDDIYAAYEVAEFLGPTYIYEQPGEYIRKNVMGYSRNFLFDTEFYEDGFDYSTAIIEGASIDPSAPNYPWPSWSYCESGENARCGDWRAPGWKETDTNTNYGAWLVRETVVPIPAAVWLFCSGLVVLIGITRR